ncbi:NADPH-dependent 1-acyl dihydroxyacetone phosphate reductase, putative [Penicillium digitatum PHI26]|uniref:NADPH-dependent 1-acyl dihydroxyacetone phosphate reductase, putative n=2 Tax=Penicillium digitatum TaxID=36651 RepID=K9G4T2_PEND2|nr:NADPH-dependent 1-acyl dihydroxyacetone phosphate reductase, putative [Penicillium digitatum Pd1]EKV15907.1 NADPH-dependent 1-acyl dihydroxyacetone phosphate reductase, putative [Penicillium digitatum PHI26]EKV20578.1 NADPH-dependent 1-acyl dihydroxyacetone phosphate reductase, putative [Penicillium digitatum Pd1]
MAPIIVLITGANRGLGQGLVKGFAAELDHINASAAIRDPAHTTAQALAELSKGKGSHVIIVKYETSVEQSAFDSVRETTDQGIGHLDIVVANAGIAELCPIVEDKSTGKPIYAIVGSGASGLAYVCSDLGHSRWKLVVSKHQTPVRSAACGASKSIVNWYGVRINAENEWLNAFVLDPGWVQTAMDNAATQLWGLEVAPGSYGSSITGMVEVLSIGTKEQYGGKVVRFLGEVQEG